jgi:hypothetical protein
MSDIPAGWQPDPRGRHEYRYWDGTQWTDHVSDQGEVSQDPVADEAPAGEAPAAAETPTEVASTPDAAPAEPAAVEPEPAAVEPEPTVVEPVIPEPAAAGPVEPVAPEPVATDPVAAEPVAAEPIVADPVASAGPPGAGAPPSTAQTEAKAAAQNMLHSKSPELGTILSVIAPGSGHFYMGTDKVPLAAGLLVATVVAVVLAYMSFALFIVGFVIWLAAAGFALTDLRGGVKGIEDTSLPASFVPILLIGAGAILVISLFLPFYHVHASAFGQSLSKNGSGWQVFSWEDIVLFVVGVGAIVAGAASLGLGPMTTAELPRQLPLAVAIGGAVAVLLLLFRMFVDTAPAFPSASGVSVKIGRAPGMLLAMDCALVLLVANAGMLRAAAANRRS